MKKSRKIFRAFLIALLLVIIVPCNVMAEEDNNYYASNVVNAGKDTGYSENNKIKKKDPHFGWSLGKFCVSGFTEDTKDKDGNPVFLKNVGDKVSLSFLLEQDIDMLNGKKALSISEDTNGYDEKFGIEKQNFGRGTLIIKRRDYQNKEIVDAPYLDYLTGIKKDANTEVILFEEGDYEICLDYEIKNNPRKLGPVSIVPTYTNYKIEFKFSVRNGNCMIYPFDAKTKEELLNTNVTENGFYLDKAKSRYVTATVKKEVLNEGATGLIEDTRFNKVVSDGDIFTEEGIYTITVRNEYTQEETQKKIYVGKEPLLKAYMKSDLPISEIQALVANGAEIDQDGNIDLREETSIEDTEEVQVNEKDDFQSTEKPDVVERDNVANKVMEKVNRYLPYIIAIITALVVLVIVGVVRKKSLKKRTAYTTKENEEGGK